MHVRVGGHVCACAYNGGGGGAAGQPSPTRPSGGAPHLEDVKAAELDLLALECLGHLGIGGMGMGTGVGMGTGMGACGGAGGY